MIILLRSVGFEKIGDDGVKSLAEALVANKSLTELK